MARHLLTKIRSRNADSDDSSSKVHRSETDTAHDHNGSTRLSLLSDEPLTPRARRMTHDGDHLTSKDHADLPIGQGSLKLEHLLVSAEDGTLAPPVVPHLTFETASPTETEPKPVPKPIMARRLSNHSDGDSPKFRARAASIAHLARRGSTAGSRRGSGSAANSPVKPLRPSSKQGTGGIASALAMSGAALTAQSGVNIQPNQFVESPPASATTGRSRASLDYDYNSDGYLSVEDAHLGGLDFGIDDLVGTGYAVASRKRNEEFHALFEDVGEDDYLIEDYGCALQKEILVQGRIYISEHHICFNANIFGWVTHLVIPFTEVISIEKRTTAFVIPNAIQVATMHARHTFASFLSRDTTYELLVNIWHISHPAIPPAALPDHEDDEENDEAEDDFLDEATGSRKRIKLRKASTSGKRDQRVGPTTTVEYTGHSHAVSENNGQHSKKRVVRKPTVVPPSIKQFKDVCLDEVFTSSPEKIYNLMFTSQAFMKDFWTKNQNLTEIDVHDWSPSPDSSKLTRTFSYRKPVNAPVGPKSVVCYITDQNEFVDFDDYVAVLTTTKTPDVPSGNSFSTLTKTCITWDRNNCCRVRVTTEVEWTARSLLKSMITSSAIEGQKSYHSELAKEMKAYIQKHKSEFLNDTGGEEIEEEVSGTPDMETEDIEVEGPTSTASARENGFLSSVTEVLSIAGETLLSTGHAIVATCDAHRWIALLIFGLVVSNLWTLRSSTSKSTVPRSPARAPDNPDDVARAVKDVLHEYFYEALQDSKRNAAPVLPAVRGDQEDIEKQLEEIEARIARMRGKLAAA